MVIMGHSGAQQRQRGGAQVLRLVDNHRPDAERGALFLQDRERVTIPLLGLSKVGGAQLATILSDDRPDELALRARERRAAPDSTRLEVVLKRLASLRQQPSAARPRAGPR